MALSRGARQALSFFILLAIGLFGVIEGARDLWRGQASTHWPSTTAWLLEARVTSEYKGRRRRTRLRVRYAYRVDGQSYESDNVSFGGDSFGGDFFDEPYMTLGRIQRAQPLLVRYDPDLPRVAVIEPGLTGGAVILSLIGVLSLGGAVLSVVRPPFLEPLAARLFGS